MPVKSFPARVKTADEGTSEAGGLGEGQFDALVSVFDVVDSYGERVRPGAFTRTLDEWAAKSVPIPIYWSHRLDDPDMNLGHVIDAKETDEGLWIRGQLDSEAPKAVTTHRLMASGRVNEFSFSYSVPPGGSTEADDGVYDLTDLTLYEVGPTPVGANPATELLGVKAGRVLSSANEKSIKDARDLLTAVLNSMKGSGDDEEDDEKARRARSSALLRVALL